MAPKMIVEQYWPVKQRTNVDGTPRFQFRNNLTRVDVGNLRIYFSFRTPIAIGHPSFRREVSYNPPIFTRKRTSEHPAGIRVEAKHTKDIFVADNFWGRATAFHLNVLDSDTDDRVSREFISEKIFELLPKEIPNMRFMWDDYVGEEVPAGLIRPPLDRRRVGAFLRPLG